MSSTTVLVLKATTAFPKMIGLLVLLSLFILVAGGGTSDNIRFYGTAANSGDTTGSDIGLRAALFSNLAYVANPDDTIYYWADSSNICSKCPACAQLGLATSRPILIKEFGLFIYIVPFATYTAVVFQGTSNFGQVFTDARVFLRKYGGCSGCKMHSGFHSSYNKGATKLLNALKTLQAQSKGTPLFITGHSLGGAQATVAAFELALLGFNVAGVATVASPRVGNADYAAKWNARVGDGVGATYPTWSLPLDLRHLEEEGFSLGALDENDEAMRPSALLLAAAAEICGFCGGLHDPTLNASATAALWNTHVAGRILPAFQGRRMFGANLGTPGSFPLGAWRIANVADPVPRLPLRSMGGLTQRYTHVGTHVLLAADLNANSVASKDMKNPYLRKIFIKWGNDWATDFENDNTGGPAKYLNLPFLVGGLEIGFVNDDFGDDGSFSFLTAVAQDISLSFLKTWAALNFFGNIGEIIGLKTGIGARHSLDEYAYRLTPNAVLNGAGIESVRN